MRHKIIAYFTGLIAICAGSAGHAFTTDETLQEVQLGEYCTITGAVNITNQAANVVIDDSSDVYYAGGFAFFLRGELWATQNKITEATIASCLGGIGAEDVELVDDGANGPNFASDDLIGFGFKLAQDANGFTANTFYSYTVGTGTLPEPDDFVLGPTADADASLTASTGADATTVPSTVDTAAEAVALLDFEFADAGGGDATPLSVVALDVNVSGTGSGNASKLTWLLNGPDATNVEGVVSGGNVTFSGLSVEVVDGGSETYTISAYFNDNTGLTEGQTIVLSIDGDTDVTVASGSTTFGATDPVTNGSGAEITVQATQLTFTTQPAGSTSGSALTTQPIVTAQDASGNTDTDFTGTVTLTEAAEGTLSGSASIAAVGGVAAFSGLTYTATADQQDFTLTASSGVLTTASSNSVTSNVVATKLTFTTQPAPTSFPGNQGVTFTTVPVVKAVDANSVVDTDFTGTVSLAEVDGAGSATFSNGSVSAVAGVATFTGLGLTYTNSGTTTETFKLEASSGSLTAAQSSDLTARLAPTVTGVSSITADGSYKAGETISIQVTFSDEVIVSGTPQLTLETGTTDRIATYAEGGGTSTLTFSYTVQAGDTAADLDYASTTALSANDGTIRSKVDTDVDAVLTLATPGGTGSLGASKALVIDTITPTGYSVSFDQNPINDGNDSAASFTFAGAEVGTDYSYTISSSGGGTNVTGSGTIATATDQVTGLDVAGLADGTLTLSVTLTDAAGNVGSAATDTSSKDATLPSGHSVAFVQSVVNDDNKSAIGFAFTAAEVGTDYSFTVSSSGGGTNVTGDGKIETATDQVTGLDLSGLEDGMLTLSVTLTDDAGNAGSAVTAEVTKDASIPAAPSVAKLVETSNSGSTTDTLTNDTTPTISGTAEANATVEIFVGTASVGTTTADGSGDWSFTFDEGDLASGANSITSTSTDAAGNVSPASSALVITIDAGAPTVQITGPTEVVTSDFTATFTFSEAVTGFDANDITVTNGTKGTFTEITAGTVYSLVITPELGTTVSIAVGAGVAQDSASNGNTAATTFTVSAGSPASEFAAHEAEIRQAITDAAQRSLNATIGANRRMNEEALDRFIATRRNLEEDGAGVVGRTNVPFDIGGVLRVDGTMLSTRGDFFAQQGSLDGSSRRLFFGDFDLQHDGDNDSTTATLTARVAWEWMQSNRTMFGYFVGGELAYSDLEGPFTGDQQRVGATIGMYAVHALDEQLFLDGYVTLGAGRNNLEMTNDVLALTSNYITRTATAGAALSGVYEYNRYEFRPELAFNYGRTWIGNVGFNGRAYGLFDDTLSLDAGAVTIANLTLRPEVIWALDADTIAESRSQFSFAPRLVCERMIATTRAEACGGGVEFGLSSASVDGLSIAEFRLVMDRVGDSNRSSFALNLEHRF